MSGQLGGQIVTFVTWALDGRGELGIRAQTPVEAVVPGCRFRPMTAKEITEGGFEAGLQMWKCTAPIAPETTGIDDTCYLKYGTDTFAVIGGPMPKTDLDNSIAAPAHVTVYAQKAS